jgi:hypothetical protein
MVGKFAAELLLVTRRDTPGRTSRKEDTMPFAKEQWVWVIQKADLVYGVNSEKGRKKYMVKGGVGKAGFTVDSLAVLQCEQPQEGVEGSGKAVMPTFLACIASHKKYFTAQGGAETNENIRRKCKAGLEWGVSRKGQVHFVLDDLDLEAVVKKNYQGKNPDRDASDGVLKNRSVTGSELRWIYRNRKRKVVQDHIQFWNKESPCLPPWEGAVKICLYKNGTLLKEVEFLPGIWATYIPKHEAEG